MEASRSFRHTSGKECLRKMNKICLGILGSTGFIGSHLFQRAKIDLRFIPAAGTRELFSSQAKLTSFLHSCDAVIDLAGVSRADDQEILYRTNMELVRKLISAMQEDGRGIPVYFGSTTHIEKTLPYHRSKRDSMALLAEHLPHAVEILMPNTFGPFAPPFYNSVISTFCVLAASDHSPERIDDALLELIPIRQLTSELLNVIAGNRTEKRIVLNAPYQIRLPELWTKLQDFKKCTDSGTFPILKNELEGDLWYTFRSYCK